MFQLLYKYLVLHKKASVPGLGVIYIETKPARLDFVNKLFVGPASHINFKADTFADDKRFYTFISHEQRVEVTEAAVRYSDFVNALRKKLAEESSVELPGIGVLSQRAEGDLFFKETVRIEEYFPPVTAERVIRDNAEHHILVGENTKTNTEMKEVLVDEVQEESHARDYWWLFAIALGIIGIATIVYYYLHNGRLH